MGTKQKLCRKENMFIKVPNSSNIKLYYIVQIIQQVN